METDEELSRKYAARDRQQDRKMIATAVLAGLAADPNWDYPAERSVEVAIAWADELIRQLGETT